jgi:hypothetical protein
LLPAWRLDCGATVILGWGVDEERGAEVVPGVVAVVVGAAVAVLAVAGTVIGADVAGGAVPGDPGGDPHPAVNRTSVVVPDAITPLLRAIPVLELISSFCVTRTRVRCHPRRSKIAEKALLRGGLSVAAANPV